jgi:hypothetical protein
MSSSLDIHARTFVGIGIYLIQVYMLFGLEFDVPPLSKV